VKTRKNLPIGLILLLCIAVMPISSSAAQTVAPPANTIPNFDCYRDANSLMAKMGYLAKTYPTLSEQVKIGKSVKGDPIYALEIGNEDNADKPHFVLLAGLHGNDFSQPEVGLQFAESLLEGYETDADLHWIVDNIEVDLILLANPDGRLEAEAKAATTFESSDVTFITNKNNIDLEENFCFQIANPYEGCSTFMFKPETKAVLDYLEIKLGELNPTQPVDRSSQDLFVYFSSHNDKSTTLPIGNIRIPWFFKRNPLEIKEPALIWQYELAAMLKVNDSLVQGSIEPKIDGGIFPDYPADYVFGSYGIASLELSTYPTLDNSPLECSRFLENHPEYYLQVLLNMAKSATQPYKIGYGPIVKKITKVEETTTEVKYRAEILDKNQIPDYPESNPITSIHYYIDQPTGTESGERYGWKEIDDNPYTSELNFSLSFDGLTPGEYILTLQACSQDVIDTTKEVCGLPLSAFPNVPDPENPGDPDPTDTPDDPDPTDTPDDPEPPNAGEGKIYLPLIGR
jgi:hypothetical protein